jgi:hypothetical protein
MISTLSPTTYDLAKQIYGIPNLRDPKPMHKNVFELHWRPIPASSHRHASIWAAQLGMGRLGLRSVGYDLGEPLTGALSHFT